MATHVGDTAQSRQGPLPTTTETTPTAPAHWRRLSIRARLIGWLGLMWLITLIGTTVAAAYITHQAEQALWGSRLREELNNSAQSMMDFVTRATMLMHMLSAIDPAVLAQQPELFEKALEQDPALLEMVRIDGEGRVIKSIVRDRAILVNMFTMPQAEWFQRAKAGEDYYSGVQYSYQDEPYLILSVAGEDHGVMAARLKMDVLQEVISDVGIGAEGRIFVTDETGNIMARTRGELKDRTMREVPAFAAILASRDYGWTGEYVSLNGIDVFAATAPVPGTTWLLGAEIPRSEAYATSRMVLVVIMIQIVLLAVTVMVGNVRFLRSLIFRPLDDLRAGTQRLAQGDYAFRLPGGGSDEIGQVTNAFNTMAAVLEKRAAEIAVKTRALTREVAQHMQTQQELEALNTTLEQRIEDRTARLQQTTDELLRSNRSLEEFAYVASHDLQEPLRKVRTFGDRLIARNGQQLDATGRDYLERMQNAALRMQSLIDALLSYSRVTTKAQPYGPVDLNHVAAEVLSDLEVQIERVGGSVKVGSLAVIEADGAQMHQVLLNLIGNGLKFHRPDTPPQVTVAGRWVESGLYEIVVSDNGIGFEQQHAERIFQVFQRLHGRSEYEGTGVGLAICRRIAERHGGTITATSVPEEGSTFTLRLAVHSAQPEQ